MLGPAKMTTFSHGLIFYSLVILFLGSAVSAFAAGKKRFYSSIPHFVYLLSFSVPDISKFEKMKHQIEKLDENLYSPEKVTDHWIEIQYH